MPTTAGGKKSKVPFPQFDFPGSPISPFTGKPYTKAQAARVHAKTHAKGKRADRAKVNAVARRLGDAQKRANRMGPIDTFKAAATNPGKGTFAHRKLLYAQQNKKAGAPRKTNFWLKKHGGADIDLPGLPKSRWADKNNEQAKKWAAAAGRRLNNTNKAGKKGNAKAAKAIKKFASYGHRERW